MDLTYPEYEHNIKILYETPNIKNKIIDIHNKYFREQIINNQGNTYTEFYERFQQNGPEKTNFAEFKHIIAYLYEGLKLIETKTQNKILLLSLLSLKCSIMAITLQNIFYYGPCIRLIMKCLEFFDIYIRSIDPQSASVDYYHKYRYERYVEYCINLAPKIIIFPTFSEISATDLLKLRPYPLFPIGVSITNIFVDEFKQTPIEFFIHDINHSRRMYEENIKYMLLEKKDINNYDQTIEFYNRSKACLDECLRFLSHRKKEPKLDVEKLFAENKSVIEIIKILNQNILKPYTDETKINIGLSAIMKIILFEIVHEDALPLQKNIICSTILRKSNEPVQFPRLEIIDGKISVVMKEELGGSILGFVKYKIRNGFFDTATNPLDVIVPFKYRTDKFIHIATCMILNKMCNTEITDEIFNKIACNITDKTGLNTPVNTDILDVADKISYKSFDYTDLEIAKFREYCKLPTENNFTGIRPKPISEYKDLTERILNGGEYNSTQYYKFNYNILNLLKSI